MPKPPTKEQLMTTVATQAVELAELRRANSVLRNYDSSTKEYMRKWKARFLYSDNTSFDRVLEDLYFERFGKKPY
jgi:hypothetical protein